MPPQCEHCGSGWWGWWASVVGLVGLDGHPGGVGGHRDGVDSLSESLARQKMNDLLLEKVTHLHTVASLTDTFISLLLFYYWTHNMRK